MPYKKRIIAKEGAYDKLLPEETLMTSEMIAATTTYFLLVDLPFSAGLCRCMPLKKGSWRKKGLRQTLPEETLMTSEMIAATTTYFLLVDLPFSAGLCRCIR
jgi:hypothetical protein